MKLTKREKIKLGVFVACELTFVAAEVLLNEALNKVDSISNKFKKK